MPGCKSITRSLSPLFAILVLAAILRLYALDAIDLRFDEASAPQFALSIANGHLLSIAPFSGSVVNHPPVFLYVLAIPYLFTRNILVVAAFRALLDVIAIALVWWLCERHFNRAVSVFACLFFTISPWAVQLSRKLSIEELPLFTVLLLWGLMELVHKKNAWGWVMSGWGLALSVGTHFSALILVPVALISWMLSVGTRTFGKIALGVLPIMVLIGVYWQYDANHGYANIQAFISGSQAEVSASLDALIYSVWISGGTHLSDLTGGAFASWQAQLPAVFDGIDSLQITVLISGICVTLASLIEALRGNRPSSSRLFGLLIIWMVIPIALQVRHSKPIQIHYVTPLYPVQFIMIGLFFSSCLVWITSHKLRLWRIISFSLLSSVLILIVCWQVFTTFRFTDFVTQYDTSHGGYGLPARAAIQVSEKAQSALCYDSYCAIRNASKDIIIVAPGGDPLANEQATVLSVINAGFPYRFANSDAGMIFPAYPAQYIIAPGAEKAIKILLASANVSSIVSETYRVRDDYPLAYTYIRITDPIANHFNPVPAATWANGIKFFGYSTSATSDILHLDIYLKVTTLTPSMDDFHWYNHLLDKGSKIAQSDGGGISPSNWRQGDILLHQFNIALPSEGKTANMTVRIGCYKYPSLDVVSVATRDNVFDDGLSLPIQ